LNGKFLHFRRDGVRKPRSFYKARIEKLVTSWETVIASNGNYIIDEILQIYFKKMIDFSFEKCKNFPFNPIHVFHFYS
jgi:hypothetical protein